VLSSALLDSIIVAVISQSVFQ